LHERVTMLRYAYISYLVLRSSATVKRTYASWVGPSWRDEPPALLPDSALTRHSVTGLLLLLL